MQIRSIEVMIKIKSSIFSFFPEALMPNQQHNKLPGLDKGSEGLELSTYHRQPNRTWTNFIFYSVVFVDCRFVLEKRKAVKTIIR